MPAALHRLLAAGEDTRSSGFEDSYMQITQNHNIPQPHVMPPPAHSLRLCLEDDGAILDSIRQERKRRAPEWKRAIWRDRGKFRGRATQKRSTFLRTTRDFVTRDLVTREDLKRAQLKSPAMYLQSSLRDKQKLALCQLRSQSTLLAADMAGNDDDMGQCVSVPPIGSTVPGRHLFRELRAKRNQMRVKRTRNEGAQATNNEDKRHAAAARHRHRHTIVSVCQSYTGRRGRRIFAILGRVRVPELPCKHRLNNI